MDAALPRRMQVGDLCNSKIPTVRSELPIIVTGREGCHPLAATRSSAVPRRGRTEFETSVSAPRESVGETRIAGRGRDPNLWLPARN